MKLYKKGGVYYADYQDGSEPVRCESSQQMWGRAFAVREVERVLGHKVSAVTCGVDRLIPPARKNVKITVGEAVSV